MKHKEKEELLESLEFEKDEINVSSLLIVLIGIGLFLLLLVPKIYISNQIYYKSREINKLLDDYEILKEENRILKQKLEYIKFKNTILNSIF